jgi:glycerol kinase
MGAAYLAGLAKGVWQSTQDIADAWQLEKIFSPTTQPTGYETWQTAVKRSMNWVK